MSIYVALDIETTGLRPEKDAVLEIGAIHINIQTLEPLNVFQTIAGMSQEELALYSMSDYVRDMHDQNGLVAEVLSKPRHDRFEMDNELAEWFSKLGAISGNRDVVICGNSIHFDRGFLEAQMPVSFRFLTHRMIDASSLLMCVSEWCFTDVRCYATVHRALPDCEASLEVLRKMREIFQKGFQPPVRDSEFSFTGNVEDLKALVTDATSNK